MSPSKRRRLLALGGSVLPGMALFMWIGGSGFTSRRQPWPLETRLARGVRGFLVPGEVKDAVNPLTSDSDAIRRGMEHFADHCAGCHANDGSGDMQMGRSLFPPAPDMRGEPTQSMGDGELFYVIEFGIPFTGMPAWSTGTELGERSSWDLVAFIRHLPAITEPELAEMEALNPKSPSDGTVPPEVRDFLQGR